MNVKSVYDVTSDFDFTPTGKIKGSYTAQAWIKKKLASGVTKEQLRSCVGIFSNRKKETVMAEKWLTEKQYKQHYDFLAQLYSLL